MLIPYGKSLKMLAGGTTQIVMWHKICLIKRQLSMLNPCGMGIGFQRGITCILRSAQYVERFGVQNLLTVLAAAQRWTVVAMADLKLCPFCGGKVSLVLCDDEGNLHDEAYRERPYSGVGFMLRHTHEENPSCPIASYECDGGILGGVYIYDTEERAAEVWNRRAEND